MQLTRTLITSALDIGIQQNGKQTESHVENQKCNQRQSKLNPYRLTIMTMPKHSATQHGHVWVFLHVCCFKLHAKNFGHLIFGHTMNLRQQTSNYTEITSMKTIVLPQP